MSNDSFDPSMNFLYNQSVALDRIFRPKTVALIGATEKPRSVGLTVMKNLMASEFGGAVIPVNPTRPSVCGVKAYPDVGNIPGPVDLAVIVTPAGTVPAIIEACAAKQIPAAVIISAGFKEMGPKGSELERQIIEIARRANMRIIGPNCLGIMNPNTGLNATFAAGMALKGSVAFISQSGALCTAVLDWSLREKAGFSAFVSIGSMLDVNWGDLIRYFGSDPLTKSILIYMESVGDARSFLSAAREVALSKPIILIKAGRSEESAKAAESHTGSLSGSDEVLSAALRRVGVLRVDGIADLFGMAEVLGKQPLPKGPRLTIVTNAGGPGVIATDALIRAGGKMAEISPESMDAYNAFLPAPWSHNNPVDILGDASPEIYAEAVAIGAKDPHTDGLLVILTPQDMTDPKGTAEKIKAFGKSRKPILASWMGADSVREGASILASAGIPVFEYPDMACQSFASMWNYSYNLKGIYEVPTLPSSFIVDRKQTDLIIEGALKEGRVILDEYESKKLLEAYHIPVVPTFIAKSAKEAVEIGQKLPFPLVLKLYSRTITHKTDVGGVKLNLHTVEEVKAAYEEIFASVKKLAGVEHFQGVTVQPMIKLEGYELILGSSLDAQFGPVLLFGSGGQLVEVYKDRALGLPPLTTTLARRMMEQTKIYHALQGVRGRKAVDLVKLEHLLVQFSRLVAEQSRIKECDINPLLASGDGLIALDARVILHDPKLRSEELPQTAIRPYPEQYVERLHLQGVGDVMLRPIRPEDEPLLVRFHQDLSQETVRRRFLQDLRYDERVAHERLQRMCFNDYDREIAIVAEMQSEILGVIRLSKKHDTRDAVFAMTVKDKWQRQGVGTKLMEKMLRVAKEEHVERVVAQILIENMPMQHLVQRQGFSLKRREGFLIAERMIGVK